MDPSCRGPSQAKEQLPFQLPRDRQLTSAFLLLPAELRVKILRCLLKKGDPIYSFGESVSPEAEHLQGRKESAYAGLSLSSQLLRTCRQLLEEGFTILYKENTLSLYFSSHERYEPAVLYFLDHEVDLSSCSRFSFMLPQGLEGMIKIPCSLHTKQDRRQCHLSYSILSRFQSMRLTIDAYQQNTIYQVCCFLCHLLLGKDVDLFVVQTGRYTPHEQRVLANLRACQRLRCRSLEIHYRPDIEGATEKLREIERVATSSVEPYDPLPSWKAFNTNVLRQLGHVGPSSFNQKHCALVTELRQSAIEFDDASFEVLKLKTLQKAKRWQEEWIEHSIESSKALINSMENMISKYTDDPHNASFH